MWIVRFKIISKRYNAICLFPFIIINGGKVVVSERLIQHEKIHYRQQLEMLILPFYVWYGLEFLYKWLKYKNKNLAYRSVSFEREAYDNEGMKDYLSSRSWYNFIKYL